MREHSYFTRFKVKEISIDSSFLTSTTKRICSKIDSIINTITSSKIISTSYAATYPSSSVEIESSMDAIARQEWQIGELNLLVTQYQASFWNLPYARQIEHMPPSFPTFSEFNQGDHFTIFQQTQSVALTYSTQDPPLVYIFSPQKAPTVTHHAPPVYTYVIVPPVSKAPDIHRPNYNHCIEIEGDAKSIDTEKMNNKMKSFDDARRGFCGFDSI